MFGYVLPSQERLNEEEKKRFQSVYCGLCHTLGRRYGFAARMILNYDLTFLAMLLQEGIAERCEQKCIAHPFKNRLCVCESASLDLAADMSVILSWWQIQDGIADHGFWKGLKYRVAALLLRRAYQKAKREQPEFDGRTQEHLQELAVLEKRDEPSLDKPADTFARLLAGAAQVVAEPTKRRVLEILLYHLGRWIYLIDAADDLEKDMKSGGYNPLPLRYRLSDGKLTDEDKRELGLTLDSSVRTMAASFELWDFGENAEVIRAVLYEGLYGVGGAVLNGTFHKTTKKKENRERGLSQ